MVIAPRLMAAQTGDREGFVKTSGFTCHSQSAKAGGLVLEGVPSDAPALRPEIWEKVIRKVGSGEMPPPGLPGPGPAVLKDFVSGLVRDLDVATRRQPYPGKPVVQRLNRNEYANAIRDLLAIDLPAAPELPQDGSSGGFSTIGDALSMSPLLRDRYLKVPGRLTEFAPW